jgi:ABC-2 type transport system permease protein
LKKVFILAINDFIYSIQNKGFYLILFIPLFIFVSENLLDKKNSEQVRIKVAVLKNADNSMPTPLSAVLKNNGAPLDVVWLETVAAGEKNVRERKVDGFLNGKILTVDRKKSPQTLVLLKLFAQLQRSVESNTPSWISSVQSLQAGGWVQQTFPTWVLMLVLLVGFIVLPAQVAEEKEKKLIFAVLQTPINEVQWLFSKLILGVGPSVISVGLLHLFSGVFPDHAGLYFSFVILGSLSFSAAGLFLGFLCRHQSSARTLGFIFYLPLLLPSALADFSQKLMSVAPWVPSYQFYNSLPGLLFGVNFSHLEIFPWVYLSVVGLIFFGFTFILIKNRWLMT